MCAMSLESEREKWMNEVEARQKNFVFPDAVRNETDGFRRLFESRKPPSPVLFVGILFLLLVLIISWVQSSWHNSRAWSGSTDRSGLNY
jgi:hypothetical protein